MNYKNYDELEENDIWTSDGINCAFALRGKDAICTELSQNEAAYMVPAETLPENINDEETPKTNIKTGKETRTISGIDNIELYFNQQPGQITDDYREKIEAGDMWVEIEFDHDKKSAMWSFEESNNSHDSWEDDYDGCLDFFEDMEKVEPEEEPELKGLNCEAKEKILKEKLIEKFPALKNRTFKISWLCPTYFEHKKKYQGNSLMTDEYRVIPAFSTFFICGLEMIEEILTYGSGMEFDSTSNVNTFYAVDPDYQ